MNSSHLLVVQNAASETRRYSSNFDAGIRNGELNDVNPASRPEIRKIHRVDSSKVTLTSAPNKSGVNDSIIQDEIASAQAESRFAEELVAEDEAAQNLEAWRRGRGGNTRTNVALRTYNRRLEKDAEDLSNLMHRKRSANAVKKLKRPSPSFHLERALAEVNDPRLIPQPRPIGTHDLSYRHAKTLNIHSFGPSTETRLDPTISLQSITAKYIRDISNAGWTANKAVTFDQSPGDFDSGSDAGQTSNFSVINNEEIAFLQQCGYDAEDAHIWACLLLEPNTDVAARGLVALAFPPNGTGVQMSPPWFMMNFLLRRRHVSAGALRLLLEHAWSLLSIYSQSKGADASNVTQLPSPEAIMILCVRLVRHARDVWPQALPNITKLFTSYVLDARKQCHSLVDRDMSPSLLRELTFKCNRMLSQLSLIGRVYPVLSATHLQRAQFDLIRKMTQFNPALNINREGHRALTKTLLLLKKTTQERDWASMQARSWPPFKVSRTGLDDPKDRTYGSSTAGRSIDYMRAYGYPLDTWDRIAQVYTGWHPDGSPSIQQRSFISAVPTSLAGEPKVDELQAAMIGSTRTLEEAWAAFLKFDAHRGRGRAVHMTMLAKILVHENEGRKRPKALKHPDNVPVFAGDGTEIAPAPTSPMEAVYLPITPPTADDFFTTVLEEKVPIEGDFMNYLVENAPSFDFAMRVWNVGKVPFVDQDGNSNWSTEHVALLRVPDQIELNSLPNLSDDLVSALISCLCNHPHQVEDLALLDRSELRVAGWTLRASHSLTYAFRLLLYYRPAFAKPWNTLLSGLAQRGSFQHAIDYRDRIRARFWPLAAWAVSGDVIRHMNAAGIIPDHATFRHLCLITHDAAIVARGVNQEQEHFRSWGDDGQRDESRQTYEAAAILSRASSLLRRQFARLVGLDKGERQRNSSSGLPRFLAVPQAAVLHRYVRALGLLSDFEGIYSLVRWAVEAADDLHELQETQVNGHQHLQRLIVAIRVWLECPERDFLVAEHGLKLEPAPDELVQLVRQEIEKVKRWSGWPSDSAVNAYCSRHDNYYAKS